MIEINKIHQGDVLAIAESIEDKSIDLIIADPPYGLPKDFGNGVIWKGDKAWVEWSQRWISVLVPKLKPSGLPSGSYLIQLKKGDTRLTRSVRIIK